MSNQFFFEKPDARDQQERCDHYFHADNFILADSLFKELDSCGSEWLSCSVLVIGYSNRVRLLVVVYVDRGDNIRIISARPCTRA